jgi:hypothetical protein
VNPTVDVDGLVETLRAFQGLEADLRREANAELRAAGAEAAAAFAVELRGAAGRSGVPVAARVASSITVKSDRLPTVRIGGSKRVGRRGAPAAVLVWGSEHGGHNFAAASSGAGYWIAPTAKRFEGSSAVTIYRRAVFETMHRYGLA